MPLYQYECDTCNDQFEELKKASERDKKVECPRCGDEAKRVLAGFAVGSSSSSSGSIPRPSSCGSGGG